MPVAGGFRFSPLHSRATLRFATFRSIPFIVSPSLGNPRKSASFIPLRSCQPAVSFRSPLASLPTSQNSKPKREATFHPSQFATFHSVITLAFPNPISGMPCGRVCPGRQKPQIPRHPAKVQVKIKEHSRMALCLQPVRLTHSNVPFVPHYTISFVHLTSFSTARVSVSCLNTHTFPDPQLHHFRSFLPANCSPHEKPRSPIILALISL
jgi:hypothetical protein